MALPPTIPTSFVPHAAAARRFRSDFTSTFDALAYLILAVVFVLALGVFVYGRILASDKTAKDTALAKAQAAIDPVTVENFVRLRNRLSSGSALLNGHIAFSGFFSSLEKVLPANVRFSSLQLALNDAGVPKVDGVGVAKSFNALAAASNAFAMDGHIKDAIFSNINVNRDGSVSFALSATIDLKIVVFSPTSSAPESIMTPSPDVPPSAQGAPLSP
ncbi:MAG: hypothetical protein NUV60_03185 [Patescibacteria group bacterium]|nr:hypothetical protein [Patescibacteria group bacterium]